MFQIHSQCAIAQAKNIDKQSIISAASVVPLPKTGIYFLVSENEIVYVGQSTNILDRIGVHLREKRIIFEKACWIEVQKQYLNSVEQLLIKKFNPKFNRAHKRNEKLEAKLEQSMMALRGKIEEAKKGLFALHAQGLISDETYNNWIATFNIPEEIKT